MQDEIGIVKQTNIKTWNTLDKIFYDSQTTVQSYI